MNSFADIGLDFPGSGDIRIGTRHVLNDAEDVPLQLRVRAIGPNEMEGPWSDLAEHLVP